MREVSGKPMTVVCLISPDLKINQKSLGRDGSKCWLGKQPVVSGNDNYSYAVGIFCLHAAGEWISITFS